MHEQTDRTSARLLFQNISYPSSYAQPRATPLHITWSLFEVGQATKTIFCRRRDVCDGQNAPTVRLLAILYS